MKVSQAGFIGVKEGGSLRFLGIATVFIQVGWIFQGVILDLDKHKGTETIPDLKNFIEQAVTDQPLSAEAHSRYRRALGRLACI